jgi:hypothetical protein
MQKLTAVKETALKVKNHIVTNKGAYALAAVAVAAIALQQSNRKAFEKFMIEKGIDPDEYYCPEYYEEKQAA